MEYRGVQHAKLAAPAGPLHDRVAIVTGAAGAIGTGVAAGLLEEGCHVVVTDLAGAALDSLAAELDAAFPGRAVGVPMDVTDAASVAEAFRFASRTWGGVDLAIVNAGIAHVAALTVMDIEAFRKLERVNVEGTLLVLAECGRHFAAPADRRRHRARVDQERLRARRQVRRLQRHEGRRAPARAGSRASSWRTSTSA